MIPLHRSNISGVFLFGSWVGYLSIARCWKASRLGICMSFLSDLRTGQTVYISPRARDAGSLPTFLHEPSDGSTPSTRSSPFRPVAFRQNSPSRSTMLQNHVTGRCNFPATEE